MNNVTSVDDINITNVNEIREIQITNNIMPCQCWLEIQRLNNIISDQESVIQKQNSEIIIMKKKLDAYEGIVYFVNIYIVIMINKYLLALPIKLLMKDGKSYSEEQQRFFTTLFMHSPKAYEFLHDRFNLPTPRTIRRWLCKINGDPGILKEAIDFLGEKCKENEYLYKECVLMIDGIAIKKHLEWDSNKKCNYGFVDMGNGPDESAGIAGEALVFLVGSLLGNWKLPVGYVLVNGE